MTIPLIQVNLALDRDLLANKANRTHFIPKSALAAQAREASFFKIRSEMNRLSKQGRRWQRTPICVIAIPVLAHGSAAIDHDAIAPQMKAVVDGMVDAKLVPDDNAEWVRRSIWCRPVHGPATQRYDDLVVTVIPAAHADNKTVLGHIKGQAAARNPLEEPSRG